MIVNKEVKVTYALQSSLDRAIDQYEKILKSKAKVKTEDKKAWDKFVNVEQGKVRIVADLQHKLSVYRDRINKMSEDEREDEPHDSGRLGDYMRSAGLPRPGPYWDPHAMISGNHPEAWALRVKLAELSIGVDDSHNGCWLPRSTKHSGQKPYPKAIPHSCIHRYNYYVWLNIRFKGVKTPNTMVERLRTTRTDLLNRGFPDSVMLKKGEWKSPYDNLPPA